MLCNISRFIALSAAIWAASCGKYDAAQSANNGASGIASDAAEPALSADAAALAEGAADTVTTLAPINPPPDREVPLPTAPADVVREAQVA
ncbi:MAG: hypothetical protein EP329_27830, partial [Deltaproteobacteria bacterium]